MTPNTRRTVALAYGALCHTSFAAGVTLMAVQLYAGLALGRGPLSGAAGWLVNLALVAQFPLLHSWLLTPRGRACLLRLAPRAVAADLSTTLFATVASWQLILLFVAWNPSGRLWWEPHGLGLELEIALYAAAWLFLGKALWDGGLALQSGFLGWSALFRGVPPAYPAFPPQGLFRFVRQPIYLGFALTLWSGPVWTPDHLLLALLWTAYCVFGPLLKEARYQRFHPAALAEYRRRVPYLIPRRTPGP